MDFNKQTTPTQKSNEVEKTNIHELSKRRRTVAYEHSGTQRKMAYTVTIRDILFNTDTVACACLLLKAGTLGLRSQPKQQMVLVCQLKFDQLTNTVNRLVKRIYTMQEMDIKT